MLSSSKGSLSSISLFVYCVSPTPPMMSHSQLLISNQCWVLYPLHPSFLSHPGRAGLLTDPHKWIPQHCTFPVNNKTRGEKKKRKQKENKKRKASFSGQSLCTAPPLRLLFSPRHASHLWHARLWFPSKADPSAQIFVNGCETQGLLKKLLTV